MGKVAKEKTITNNRRCVANHCAPIAAAPIPAIAATPSVEEKAAPALAWSVKQKHMSNAINFIAMYRLVHVKCFHNHHVPLPSYHPP